MLCCAELLLCLTFCDPMDCSPPGSSIHGDSPGKNTGVSCHALLQVMFPTRGSNPGLPHGRQILYILNHLGSCKYLIPFHNWIVFHCMDAPHFIYPLISWWTPVCCFHLLAVGSKTLSTGRFLSCWRRKWQPTPVSLPGKSHGQRSLTGYSPQGLKESDMVGVTEQALQRISTSRQVKSNRE